MLGCIIFKTDATGNLGIERHQYSSTFEKERGDLNVVQYSSRNQPRDRLEMGHLDPYTRAQNKVDADLSASRSVGVSSYRSDVHNLKPTPRLTDSRTAAGKLVDNRYNDTSQASSLQNPYNRNAGIYPGSTTDSFAVNSGMDKRYSAASNYENTQMIRDRDRRLDDNLHTDRQMPNISYSSPRENYPPPSAAQYGSAVRHPPSVEVETALNRVGTAPKKYSSPAEEDLRRSLYDKKYQMEAQAAVQKKQAQALGDSRSHLLQREVELERTSDQRLDSARGRYSAGRTDRMEPVDRRQRDVDNTRLSSAAVAPSSKLDQRGNIVKSTDPSYARSQFTKAENGREPGVERGRGYSDLNEKPSPRPVLKLKDDYYRADERQRESVSGRRVQINTVEDRQPQPVSTTSARDRFQHQNERLLVGDGRRLETGPAGSSTRKADDNRPTGRQETSSSLMKMKQDLLRDQVKLDEQLRENAVVSEERSQRADDNRRRDNGRSSDLHDTDFRRSMSRSSYITDDRMVWLFLVTTSPRL